ncbi:DUF3703 domain-containing protein [Flavihumibacter sp. UBA7668]|uniref:DUF3703 domain-containing protein n=1 Tax=Flavihumibacter sp. UBA7668 TaxID=1946542 RepID=UPI0025B97DA3|nr:DUF3703 domain-containing protein [Flavihumibacter sp. UBA7668]
MKFYWNMPSGLQVHYRHELDSYQQEMEKGNLPQAWRQLERAHILGQPWLVQHNHVHWLMLKFGISIKSRKEILGQLLRLIFGGVKSFVGKVPTGNTGGSDVPPLKKMELPEDLENLLRPYRSR